MANKEQRIAELEENIKIANDAFDMLRSIGLGCYVETIDEGDEMMEWESELGKLKYG